MNRDLHIKIRIDSKTGPITETASGLRQLDTQTKTTSTEVSHLTKNILLLGGALGGLSIISTTSKSYLDNADAVKRMRYEVQLAVDTVSEYATAEKELYKIAQDAHTEFESTASLYAKITQSTEELNYSQNDLLVVTETISKALGSSEGANAALTQLGQGLGSGALRGDELNSVMEQTPRLARAIAEGMGITLGQLRAYGAEGKISAQAVIDALKNQASVINAEFANMELTMDHASKNADNAIMRLVGRFEESAQVSSSLAHSIVDLSDTIDEIDVDNLVESAENFALIATSALGAHYTIKSYVGVLALAKTAQSALAVSTTTYNKAGILATTTTKRLTASQIASTAATKGLSLAMRAVPFVAITAAIAGIASAALDASEEVDWLGNKFEEAALKAKNFTKNQAAYELEKLRKERYELFLEEEELEKTRDAAKYAKDVWYLPSANFTDAQASRLDTIKQKINEILKAEKALNKMLNPVDTAQDNPTNNLKTEKELKDEQALQRKLELLKTEGKAKELKALEISYRDQFELYKNNEEMLSLVTQAYTLEKAEVHSKYAQKAAEKAEANIQKVIDEANAATKAQKTLYEQALASIATPMDNVLQEFSRLEEGILKSGSKQEIEEFYRFWASKIEDVAKEQNKLEFDSSFLDGQIEALDNQIALSSATMDWADNLGGAAGAINGVSKSFKAMHVQDLELKKKKLEIEKKYSKQIADEPEKRYALEEKQAQELQQLKEIGTQNEIQGYAQIAGAASAMFEQGSKEAAAFGMIQSGLAIVAGVQAILTQGQGDPYTAFARMAAMAASVASFLSNADIAFGGGGAGGISQTQKNQNTIDATYTPVTDRLDAQITLLESIDNKTGTASQASMELAQAEFDKGLATYANEKAYEMHGSIKQSWGAEGLRSETFDTLVEQLGFSIGRLGGYFDYDGTTWLKSDSLTVDRQAISDPDNFIALLEAYNSGFIDSLTSDWYVLFDKAWEDTNMNAREFAESQLAAMTAEYQTLVSDFASAIFDSRGELLDAKESMEDIFDAITGTEKFQQERLEEAQKTVDGLRGDKSFTEYLLGEAENISKLDNILSQVAENGKTYEEILLSQDPTQLKEQNRILSEIQEKTNFVFDEGGRSVLNYMESIELLGDTMAEVTAETKDLQSQVFDLIASENEKRAATLLGLDASNRIYQEFIYSVEDAQKAQEQELETRKSSLEEERTALNDYITDITSNISTLEGSLSNIEKTIDKLKVATLGSSYSLQNFYDLMSSSLSLAQTDNYAEYADTVSKAISASSVLYEDANFQTEDDKIFAQMTALNQFGSLEETTLTQIDYLEKIEENTRGTLLGISTAISNMGQSVSGSLQDVVNSVVANNPNYASVVDSSKDSSLGAGSFEDRIYGAYRAITGHTPDADGMAYWLSRTDLQDANTTELYTAIARGANNEADVYKAVKWLAQNTNSSYGQNLAAKSADSGIISQSSLLDMMYQYGLGRSPDSGKQYWLDQKLSAAELLSRFPRGAEVAGDTYRPFSLGGYTGDGNPLEYAGWVHKKEFVLNAKTTSDLGLNNGGLGVFAEMNRTLAQLKAKVTELTIVTEKQANFIREINKRDERLAREA